MVKTFKLIELFIWMIISLQLLMVVHFKHHCNTYGSLSAYIVGLAIRLSGGEPLIGLPALIHFPGYDEESQKQLFPFRTTAMLLSLFTLWGVSYYSKWVFETGRLAPQYDYFRCVVNIPDDAIRVGDPSEVGEQVRFRIFLTEQFSLSTLHNFFIAVTRHGRSYGKNLRCCNNGWKR